MKTSLLDLLMSDLYRYRELAGAPDRPVRKRDLWECLKPRSLPVTLYRISHHLHLAGLTPLAQIVAWLLFFMFGAEINCRTKVGPGLFLPHANGIVIGAISIGANATIYHQVTIGASRLEFDMINRPVVGSDVTIGSGAKILGDITIPDGAFIAANSVISYRNVKDLAGK